MLRSRSPSDTDSDVSEVEDKIQESQTSQSKIKNKSKKARYLCKYSNQWEKQFTWLRSTHSEFKANCQLCNKQFSVSNQGLHQVKQHEQTKCHKKNTAAVCNNNILTNFSKKDDCLYSEQLASIELSLVFHNVKHNLSYRSFDCGIKLIKNLFKDYAPARGLQLGRTKAEVIVQNVLAPWALEETLDDLSGDVMFAVQIDASNIKNYKYFPITVQYYKQDVGVVNKLINFVENPDETAMGMYKIVKSTFENLNLSFSNISCLSADNCNANFGQYNSLFTQLKTENTGLLKANCHVHILHNTVKHFVNQLDYDVESLILKLYAHFSISAKRLEELKGFANFVNIEHQDLLRHVTTRWLSLNPSIDKILKNWPALLSYFRSCNECPRAIQKLLYLEENVYEDVPNNIIPEVYLLFCNNLLKLFEENILLLEKNKITIIELFEVFETLFNKLCERKEKKFFGYLTSKKIKCLDNYQQNKIEQNFIHVLNIAIKYLNKWFNFDKEKNFFYIVGKLNLHSSIAYEDLVTIIELIPDSMQSKLHLNLDEVFDELTYLNTIINVCLSDSTFKDKLVSDKWFHIFTNNIRDEIKNIYKLMQYILSIPVSTAFVERIFSVMNLKWSDVRNQCSTNLIKSELLICLNFSENCGDFHKKIVENKYRLRKVQSNDKYK